MESFRQYNRTQIKNHLHDDYLPRGAIYYAKVYAYANFHVRQNLLLAPGYYLSSTIFTKMGPFNAY